MDKFRLVIGDEEMQVITRSKGKVKTTVTIADSHMKVIDSTEKARESEKVSVSAASD